MAETRTPKQIDADKLDELIERLETAEGPSLELDGMIWCAANGYEFVMWDGAGCVYRDPNAPNWNRCIQHADATTVRPYSASLDAAAALAERLLPGWNNSSIKTGDGEYAAYVWLSGGDGPFRSESSVEHIRSSRALALCLAILKAVRAHMHPRDREETNNG